MAITQKPARVAVADPAGNLIDTSLPTSVVEQDGAQVNGSISALGTVFTVDMTGYESISVDLQSIGSGNTLSWESSEDGVNWRTVPMKRVGFPAAAISSVAGFTDVYKGPKVSKWFRLRCTTYSSGTITAVATLHGGAFPNNIEAQARIIPQTQSSITPTNARIHSGASTNATSVKGSSGVINHLHVGNSGSTDAWLKFYNSASTPTAGSGTPLFCVYLPPKWSGSINVPSGLGFSSGIGYTITGGAADSDTTAVTAAQVTGALGYS